MAAPMITLTDVAAERVKALIAKSDKPVQGLRIGVRTRGCSGLSYFVEYADAPKKFEDIITDKGVKILLGTVMDYVEGKLQSGFVFSNPNEKSRCGCGESFSV